MLYKGITSFRNYLFNQGILKEFHPDIYSIGVGNLNVGGSGKTPMTDYLLHLLQDKQLAVISRGYGRKTSGFMEINTHHTASEVGDEPLMLFEKYQNNHFFVSEKRVEGYQKAVAKYSEIECFIFDDVFQHRYIKPHFNILLTDYHKPFYKDRVLPWGRLRESKSGAKRADLIVVTKVPENLDETEKNEIRKNIAKYTKSPVIFAAYRSLNPINQNGDELKKGIETVLISALANNNHFFAQQSKHFKILKHFAYRDHYRFTSNDMEKILSEFPDVPIITTDKDWVKIKTLLKVQDQNKFYMPEISVIPDSDIRKYINI